MPDLFKVTLTPVEAEKVGVGYLVKENILMRKWSPTECDNGKKGETVYQIVVPTIHRREVLGLTHDFPMSGHLGIHKTYNRVYNIIVAWSQKRRSKVVQRVPNRW